MSEKEHTQTIIKKMHQSKVYEWIMLILLTLSNTSLFIYYLPKDIINKSIGKILYSLIFGPTQLMFMTILYFQMKEVNEQFYRLFT